jgi:ParB-like chromosome segregation protein Spo0J
MARGLVIDGAHRVAAARQLGLPRLQAMVFDGSTSDAFVEFVRRNMDHGLVLTLRERKRAALRVLRLHREWSDRRIAELCGISPKTVGRLRADHRVLPREDDPEVDGPVRVGRDERARPARGSVRPRVEAALRDQPTASLREIAGVVGVSPETVRLIRMNFEDLSDAARPAAFAEPPAWRADSALASADESEHFLSWFDGTALTARDLVRAESVPLSRVYELADEARRRADVWLQLARRLEARSAKSS